jgi:CMP-N,N'-diacetyllegionaminic acid synthase
MRHHTLLARELGIHRFFAEDKTAVIEGKRVLAVVPARGGSKGIKLKNLQKIRGIPLIGIVGLVIQQCRSIDRAVVSTDHPEIMAVAGEYGIDAPFTRPNELSGDLIPDMPVLRHALTATEADDGKRYDIVVMLQPTSPLRRATHVEQALKELVDKDLDTVWTVSETDSKGHPLKQLVLKDGRLSYYDPRGVEIVARQQLPPVYHRNGVAYVLNRAWLLDHANGLLGARNGAIIIEESLANIDVPLDLRIAELLVNEGAGDALRSRSSTR